MSIRLTLHALLIVTCLVSQLAQAEVKEYIRDYNYQGEPYDTAATCRVNAIDGVKRELLDELGTYVGSVVKQHQDSLGSSYMSHDVVNITAGIVALKVLEEKWKQPVYFVKAGMKADPDDVLAKLKAMRADLELEKSLRDSYEELQNSRNEVAQLKTQLAQMMLARDAQPVARPAVQPAVPVVVAAAVPSHASVQPAAPATTLPVPVVPLPVPEAVPAAVHVNAHQAQAGLALDAAAAKSAPPAAFVPAASANPVAREDDAKLVTQYVKAVQDVEVGEAFQRAMAVRMNGDFAALFREMSALAEKGYAKAKFRWAGSTNAALA